MIKKIDHIGIVVKDLNRMMEIYSKSLGLEFVEIREFKDVPLKVAVYRTGEILVELLEYGKPDAEPARTLRGNQEGLNHVCYEVDRFDETMKKLQETGFQLIPGFPRGGVHGKIAFFNPPPPSRELIEILTMEDET